MMLQKMKLWLKKMRCHSGEGRNPFTTELTSIAYMRTL